jgi:hypothetical protein
MQQIPVLPGAQNSSSSSSVACGQLSAAQSDPRLLLASCSDGFMRLFDLRASLAPVGSIAAGVCVGGRVVVCDGAALLLLRTTRRCARPVLLSPSLCQACLMLLMVLLLSAGAGGLAGMVLEPCGKPASIVAGG